MADGDSRLDLNALADEVIRLHRLTSTSQSVAQAVQDFAQRVGRDRMPLAFLELAGLVIRARVKERAEAAMKTPAFTAPKPREAAAPARIPPAMPGPVPEPEPSGVPEPGSRGEFRPNAVLWHTTQSDQYDGTESESEAPAPAAVSVTPVPEPAAEARPATALVPVSRPVPAMQQPSSRLAAMRSMTPEETWGALADLVDIGDGTSKARGKLSRDDLLVIVSRSDSKKKEYAKLLTEEHHENVKARRELDALRRHGAELIEELPGYELDRLYGQRAA